MHIQSRDDLLRAIRAKIEADGLTHDTIAERAGMARPNVCRALSGNRNFSVDTALRLAKAVGVKILAQAP